MSDENENLDNEEKTTVSPEIAAMQEQIDKLAANNAKLLDEKNEAKRQKDEAARILKEKEELSLKEKEDFKTLYSNTDEENKTLKAQFEEYKNQIAQRDIDQEALTLSTSLQKSDANRAKLLAQQVKQYIKHTPNGVVYETGGLEVSKEKVVELITKEFPFLIDGLGAAGGGALGSKGGGAVPSKEREKAIAEAKKSGDITALRKAHEIKI